MSHNTSSSGSGTRPRLVPVTQAVGTAGLLCTASGFILNKRTKQQSIQLVSQHAGEQKAFHVRYNGTDIKAPIEAKDLQVFCKQC